MGTSTAFEGQAGHTPLVPSWLDDDGVTAVEPGSIAGDTADDIQAPEYPPLPLIADPTRFTSARNSFSRFATSGGRDRKNLGRALANYVGASTGGSRAAATRMGAARGASGRLLSFLTDSATRGVAAALQALDLGALAGRPIEEVFVGLAEYVCPDGGSIDEGIARAAFVETIADLAGAGVVDLDNLTTDQIQTVFEIYITHAIEARICNDIGTHAVTFPRDSREAAQVQAQLHDFIQRSVGDAVTTSQRAISVLTPRHILSFVGEIYEQAFRILQVMAEAEVDA